MNATGRADARSEAPADVEIGGPALTVHDIVDVARSGATVRIAPTGVEAMQRSRSVVEDLAGDSDGHYGISTGFGALANRRIAPSQRLALQLAIIRSHAAGMGTPMAAEVVRGTMLLRARSLAMGYSGVRPVLVERMVAMLNAGVVPLVPEHGSLGCSGDLAPLAHIALTLIGEGPVIGGDVGDIEPLVLAEKEGLALINGTDGMLAMLALACVDFLALLKAADVAAAMSVEALLGTDRVFADDLQHLRPHPGQATSAANIRRLLDGSVIVSSHVQGDSRVQDAYSLRCAPQVAGAARDTLAFAWQVADRELAAAIDNPVVLPDGRVESNGNFHGAPLGFACDFLAIAAAEVGAISERRTDRLLDRNRSHGLPPFLAHDPGVDSGLMIAQYTAAAMVAENRRLAAPASVDSLPTSAMQEDHVSMGWAAATKLRTVLSNLTRILAIEAMTAARGLDLRAPLEPASGTASAVRELRRHVEGPGPDRVLSVELAAAERLLADGSLVAAVEQAVGPLG